MYFDIRFALTDQSYECFCFFMFPQGVEMCTSCVAPLTPPCARKWQRASVFTLWVFEFSCEAKALPSHRFQHGPKIFCFF